MIGAGAIALGMGIFGFALGSMLALPCAVLLASMSWWALFLEATGREAPVFLRIQSLQLTVGVFVAVVMLELALA